MTKAQHNDTSPTKAHLVGKPHMPHHQSAPHAPCQSNAAHQSSRGSCPPLCHVIDPPLPLQRKGIHPISIQRAVFHLARIAPSHPGAQTPLHVIINSCRTLTSDLNKTSPQISDQAPPKSPVSFVSHVWPRQGRQRSGQGRRQAPPQGPS
jgi:hypothetical protein